MRWPNILRRRQGTTTVHLTLSPDNVLASRPVAGVDPGGGRGGSTADGTGISGTLILAPPQDVSQKKSLKGINEIGNGSEITRGTRRRICQPSALIQVGRRL